MMNALSCPDTHELRRLASGELPAGEAGALERHVRACRRCSEALDALHKAAAPPAAPAAETIVLGPRGATCPKGPALAADAETAPHQVGRYEVLGPLGSGGMGTVYRALDPQLRRAVAVKVPHFHGGPGERAEAARRFLREARAAAAVHHPNVCPIHDVGEQEGVPYVVLALVDGESLAERLDREGRLDGRTVATLVHGISLGLAAVHEKGVVHRDLKPGNVLLDRAGRPLLSDFGLARTEADASRLTADGAVVGTPAYMAPEQEVGAPADVWAAGAILYHCLTGTQPFAGATVLEVLEKVKQATPPPPRSVAPEAPAALEAICLRCLRPAPGDRPTARELAEMLERFLASGAAPTVAFARPARRRHWRWLAAAAAVLVAGPLVWRAVWPPPRPASEQVNKGPDEAEKKERPPRPVVQPGGPKKKEPAPAPLPIVLRVRLYRDGPKKKALEQGELGKNTFAAKFGDLVRLEVKLSRPAHAYLIGFHPNGEEELLWPTDPKTQKGDRQKAPPRVGRFEYPPRQPGDPFYFTLSDEEKGGLQAFAVVASDQPLPPFAQWQAKRGAAAWRKLLPGEGVWEADEEGTFRREAGAGEPRGPVVSRKSGVPPLDELVESLHRAGVARVEVVAFPVGAKGGE